MRPVRAESTALIQPIPRDLALNKVVIFNIGITLFLALFAWRSPQKQFGRGVGGVAVVAYAACIALSMAG